MSPPAAGNAATVVVRRGPLAGPVLARVVGMLAARAQFPVDRLDDALLVTDALAAHGGDHADDPDTVAVTIVASEGELELRVGPLRPEGGAALLADAELPGVGNVLERVADDVRVDDRDGAEHLVVRLGGA